MRNIPLDTVLKTIRLRLRAVSFSAIDLVWSASRISGFNSGMVWDPPQTKEELIPITEKNLAAWIEGVSYTFTIDLHETKTPVGRVAIRYIDNKRSWNIGYWIHPVHWNKGYATEAALAVIKFGFSELSASKITTAHAIFNAPSKRVIEKLGFQFTGENPCGFKKQGKPVAEYEYVINAPML